MTYLVALALALVLGIVLSALVLFVLSRREAPAYWETEPLPPDVAMPDDP